MDDLERELAAAAERYDQGAAELRAERDRLIVEAVRAGVPRKRIADLAGLSEWRIYQIIRTPSRL